MWIGLGILLLVIGAVVEWALDLAIPGISSQALGWILIAGGILCIILSFAVRPRREVQSTVDQPGPGGAEYHESATGGPIA